MSDNTKQLYKKSSDGSYPKIFPLAFVQGIKDKRNQKELLSYINEINHFKVDYNENPETTRCQVDTFIRKKGLYITYYNTDTNENVTEYFKGNQSDVADDSIWGNSDNWELVPDKTYIESHAVIPDKSVNMNKLADDVVQAIGDSGLSADEEDLTDRNSILSFKDKEYNVEEASGLGYKILRKNWVGDKNILTQDMINEANTIYEIRYDYILDKDITILANCVLKFNGGSIANAIGNEYQIDFNNGCYIDAPESAVIFKDIVFTSMNISGGVLKNTTLYPAWFGCTIGSDLVQTLPAVMACAYATGVHNIQFSSGTYVLSGEVIVGGIKYVNFDLNIKGNGLGLYGGTIFSCTTASSRFRIDMSESEYGIERTFHISDIAFEGYNKENNALMVTQGMCCSIERCRFRSCDIAIKFVNATYLTKVDSCIFNNCNNGIYADNDPDSPDYINGGQTNNNVISNCIFTHCSISTIDLRSGNTNGWQIIGGDCEGSNGPLYLGSNNFIRGTRLERNLDSVPYLIIGSYCRIYDIAIHTAGGSPTWRIVIEGDNNYIDCLINGFNPFGIISYGKGNKFNIITKLTEGRCLNIYDENDEFILNGYSNKKDYLEEANQTGWFSGGTNSDKLINKGLKQYKSLSTRINELIVMNPVKYITGFVYSYDNNIADGADSTIIFYGSGCAFKNINKWFVFNIINASLSDSDLNLFFIAESYQSNTWKESCINITCSQNIPIYNRPCVGPHNNNNITQKDFHAYYDKNGYIQLVDTYLNYQYRDFGLVTNKRQIFKTPFGKKFYHNGTDYLDMNNNVLILTNTGAALMANIPYAKIEVFDLNTIDGYLNGEIIFNTDGSHSPDVLTIKSKTLSFGDKNFIGTVDIVGSNNYVVYKTIIALYKGLVSYSNNNNKPVWWNGTAWVDATGVTV